MKLIFIKWVPTLSVGDRNRELLKNLTDF
jgi:hypothetical protein